jgi:hypothetical protein
MNDKDFRDVARRRLIHCEYVLIDKAKEYARDDDRLHNFKRASEISSQSPEMCCFGMFLKHVVSIEDMVKDLPNLPDRKTIDEKIGDAINYLILLEALIAERNL